MRTVRKYPITPGQFTIEMPRNAKILCIQVQGCSPQMWAKVDPNETVIESRNFEAISTGMEFMPTGDYVGTFQLMGGSLVFHVFEREERSDS